jgi:hypothetical protein
MQSCVCIYTDCAIVPRSWWICKENIKIYYLWSKLLDARRYQAVVQFVRESKSINTERRKYFIISVRVLVRFFCLYLNKNTDIYYGWSEYQTTIPICRLINRNGSETHCFITISSLMHGESICTQRWLDCFFFFHFLRSLLCKSESLVCIFLLFFGYFCNLYSYRWNTCSISALLDLCSKKKCGVLLVPRVLFSYLKIVNTTFSLP